MNSNSTAHSKAATNGNNASTLLSYSLMGLIALVVATLGIYLTRQVWKETENHLTNEHLRKANLPARALETPLIEALNASELDYENPHYLRLKDSFVRLGVAFDQYRSVRATTLS